MNCNAARGALIPSRAQSCIAIEDGDGWMLVNASPDIRAQLTGFSEAAPGLGSRQSPLTSVVITNADLDHTLGLPLLREGPRLKLLTTDAIQGVLTSALPLSAMLESFCGIEWSRIPMVFSDEDFADFSMRAIPLPGSPPRYAKRAIEPGDQYTVALQLIAKGSNCSALIAPAVPAFTPALLSAMAAAEIILLDGTFWDEEELQKVAPDARTASEMGHIPVKETLTHLQHCPARLKAFLHINNTNPILRPGTPEREAVLAAGVLIPEDGAEFQL